MIFVYLQVFVTQSNDRSCRVYSQWRGKKQEDEYHCTQLIQKASIGRSLTLEQTLDHGDVDYHSSGKKILWWWGERGSRRIV